MAKTPRPLNMVVAIDTSLPLPDLLRLGLDIEQVMGASATRMPKVT